MEQYQNANPFISVSNIHNKKVYDSNGNDCGAVTSLLFDPKDNNILFAIINLESESGNLEATAIPWNSININPNTGVASIQLNKNLLIKAPKINASDFKLSNKNNYFTLLKYYGYSLPEKKDEGSPISTDLQENFHQHFEGGEYTRDPKEDKSLNSLGDEVDFDKIRGKKVSD